MPFRESTYALLLTPKGVTPARTALWEGTSEADAAARYLDCIGHEGETVYATQPHYPTIGIGIPRIVEPNPQNGGRYE